MERLAEYESLLIKWQKSINLVSAATLPELWRRHMLDSAQIAGLAPENAVRWADLGSGGGFPGLVIAILLRDRPGFGMHLVESDQRKCVFMREVARALRCGLGPGPGAARPSPGLGGPAVRVGHDWPVFEGAGRSG